MLDNKQEPPLPPIPPSTIPKVAMHSSYHDIIYASPSSAKGLTTSTNPNLKNRLRFPSPHHFYYEMWPLLSKWYPLYNEIDNEIQQSITVIKLLPENSSKQRIPVFHFQSLASKSIGLFAISHVICTPTRNIQDRSEQFTVLKIAKPYSCNKSKAKYCYFLLDHDNIKCLACILD